MDTQLFMKQIKEINEKLKEGKGLADPELLAEFDSKYTNLANSIDKIQQKERNLRIGIVGAVKAGKSTFLNSLLFDGEDILPKAPTPMTAALTRVKYAQQPSAKIVFYSEQEWRSIEDRAQDYKAKIEIFLKEEQEHYLELVKGIKGMTTLTRDEMEEKIAKLQKPTFESVEAQRKESVSKDLSSCYELVEMLEEDSSVREYLKQGEITLTASGNYNEEIQNFVGAHGKYTPIVKYTELVMDNELLKGLEIVDTPGLNDPIRSRSKKTQDFLMECDVVFVLSKTSQFLGAEDMNLICDILPAEGIQRAVIVASQFDDGILDYKRRNATFKEAFGATVHVAKRKVESELTAIEKIESSRQIAKNLRQSELMFSSGLMYSAAKKQEKNIPLNEEEEHMLERFQKQYSDFECSTDLLFDLSGVNEIRDKVLEDVRTKKEEIVRERIEQFLESQRTRFVKLLEDINAEVRKNLQDINQYEYEALQEKSKKLSNNLDSVRKSISAKFSDAAIDAEKQLQVIIAEVNDERENYRTVETNSKEVRETETKSSGPFGIMKQDVIITKRIQTVNIDEVVKNIQKYCAGIHRIVIDSFDNLIDIEGLKKQVKEKVQGAFDTADKDFDPEEIAITLNQMIGGLTVPKLDLDVDKYTEAVLSRIVGGKDGIVEGEAIAALKLEQSMILQKVFDDVKEELTVKGAVLSNELNRCAGEFIDNVEKKMVDSIKRLQGLLEDKEKGIKRLEDYKETISECKKIIRDLEMS